MIKFGHRRFLSVLLIAVFVLTRFAVSAHAAEYRGMPHKHDGAVCTLSFTAEDDDIDDIPILPANAAFTPPPKAFFICPAPLSPSATHRTTACARGPPTL